MAVRRRARDIKSGERSVRTGATLDDDAFIECDAEWLGDHAANRIAGAAGSEYGNEARQQLDLAGLKLWSHDRERRHVDLDASDRQVVGCFDQIAIRNF